MAHKYGSVRLPRRLSTELAHLKCRCLPLWCRLRRTKLEALLILLLIGGSVYFQQQGASYIVQLEAQEALTESYMQSASCEIAAHTIWS